MPIINREKERQIVQEGLNQGKDEQFIKQAIIRFREQQTKKPEQETTGFFKRLQLGFGTKEERESRVEPKGFLKGGLAEVPRDIADVIGKSLPVGTAIFGGTAGGVAGAAAGGVGAIPGAALGGATGGATGEMFRQRIGELIGVQKEKGIEKLKGQTKEIAFEGLAGGAAELGGRLLGTVAKQTGKVIKPLKDAIARFSQETTEDILKATTGVPKKAIERATLDPQKVRSGFKPEETATTIRQEAVDAFNKIKSALGRAFKEGLERAEKEGVEDIEVVKTFFKEDVIDKFIDQAKNFGIKFKGNQIVQVPAKLRGEAEKNLKEVFSLLTKQKDFTPKVLQRFAEDIQSFRKFTSADLKSKSTPIVGGAISDLSNFIKKASPTLGETRAAFSKMKSILDNADAVLNATKGKFDIKPVRSSVSKLTNLFKEDNDLFIDAIVNVEKASGRKFLSKLAGTEFQRITPDILRTSLAVGGIGTGAAFVNPMALLLLPIFSPRAVGGFITRKAQSKQLLNELFKIGLGKEALPVGIRAIINRIVEGELSE